MNRDATPSPLAGEGWGEGSRDDSGDCLPNAMAADGGATPHPAASRPPSPAGGEGKVARFREVLKGRARTMRKEPTEAERKLWYLLRDRRFSGFKFRRQVQIGHYIVDFVCPSKRLIVEADGSQHAENSRDEQRDAWLAAQGFRIRRFWNSEILTQPEDVQNVLWHDLEGRTLHDTTWEVKR